MCKQGQTIPAAGIAMRLATAYQASQALAVATRFGIPDLLGQGSMTSSEIAQAIGAQPAMMHRLMRALAAFDVVEDLGDEKFKLTAVGDCLRAGAPSSVRDLVLMYGNDTLLQTVESLAECIRTGKNAFDLRYGLDGIFPYLEKHPELARIFDDAMSGRSSITGQAAAQAFDFAGVSRIVDVAGGHGGMLASILKEHPHLRGTLFDLPRVVNGASASLALEGLADRCEVVAGDMFDSVPAGGDLYLLSRVIHDWDDARALKLLQVCRRAMSREARLLIVDRVLPERIEPSPMGQSDVLLDLTMMLWTVGGRERTAQEFKTLLRSAGLQFQRVIPMQIPDSLVEATPM
jgi:hypothetical protein